ncbi:CDP-glycerol glycerophosphotransferase family protein [Carnobacterium mobile]|uniref:CDP-glycerol glycerophosphotransferase family protein n=1 Tax=Carnobacterium mobile TaxID=2750 RepID=UPI001867CAE9|nr:CDP-glycerol glycerophosphotransferase family protein [Carnobacterium mobile]
MKILVNMIGATKLCLAFVFLKIFKRNLYQQSIWLVCEKPNEARDNGYHLFKYIRQNYPNTNFYYVIEKGSSDKKKISEYGNILDFNSFKHCVYYLASERCISSQSMPFPYSNKLNNHLHFLRNKKMKTVWLQHGITKDKLKHEDMDYKIKKYDLLACAAEKELNFIKKEYGYPDKVAVNIGFCRYDNLYKLKNTTKKIILIMPTFRSWLSTTNPSRETTLNEQKKFEKSEFYSKYIELLNNKELNFLLTKHGYKIIFYPHYALQNFINTFQESISNENIIIADRKNFDVQDLLIKSSILITDYSSVFFDFAYMKKPIIYYQFDEVKYRDSHYKEGYFNYKNDGFGLVTDNLGYLINELTIIISNEAVMNREYSNRVDNFFTFTDDNNCLRTYNTIKSID